MKTQTLKEIAKFSCGVTAWESFVHASLWASGVNPVIFGITMTDPLNQVQTFIPAIISVVLGYYGWCRKTDRPSMESENINNRRPTNWFVITGGPSSGKTTTVNILRERGYITTMEHARHFLDTQRLKGRTIEEVRKNQREFQLGVLEMQIQQEHEISPDVQVFLDRAIPDALAYYRFLNLPVDKKLEDALKTVSYKKVFIMDNLPLKNDYARTENVIGQKKIHELITEVYESLPFPVVHVPVLPTEERVDFILKNL